MISYSIIKKSELEGAKRIDAEYYQPEYLKYINKLKMISSPLKSLVSTIKHPAEIERIYNDTGLPFLLTQNISPEYFVLQFDEKRFISIENAEKIPQNKLEPKDVVVTRTGANYGDASLYFGKPEKLYASAHILIIRPRDISGEFLVTFLNSKIGRALVKRGIYGTSQPEISPEYLKTLPIPLPNKETADLISNFVYLSYKELENSKSLYSEAESLLLEELGLEKFEEEIEKELWSVVNLSEVKKANRIDAEYFQPKYQKMFSAIKKYDVEKFGDMATIKKGFEPGSEAYQDEGKLFIRVSSISKDGITDKDQKYLKDDLYQKLKKDYEPKIGEILLTKDASPGIAYVVKEQIEGLISGGVLRIKIKEDIEPEYIALIINSLVGQMQVERDAGGSIIAHWKSEQVKEMQIPILSKPIQQKIAELVQKSHKARKKAKELLKEAKRKVEELIENN